MAYEEKLVAFIDLLGFKESSKKVNEKSITHGILSTNHQLVELLKNFHKEHPSNNNNDIVIQTFSDSIFLTYPKESLYTFLRNLAIISLIIASRGFFLRGGIAFGNIYATNDDKYFYGPALIDAYEAESKTATYPRIILHKSMNSIIKPTNSNVSIYDEHLLCTDFDKKIFINFLADSLEREINTHSQDICNYIKKGLKKGLKAPNIWLKYIWLMTYYNDYAKSHNLQLIDLDCHRELL